MKNKEIEEMIQNRIDDIYQSGEYIYQAKELEKILLYIEQLEKELKEEQEDSYKQSEWLVKKQKKIEQLENNRDKAIKYINKNIAIYHKQLPLIAIDYEEVINILKGGSDE